MPLQCNTASSTSHTSSKLLKPTGNKFTWRHWFKKILKPIHWVNSSAQWSLFQRMTADVSSTGLERFGENDPFFNCLQSEWVLALWSNWYLFQFTTNSLYFTNMVLAVWPNWNLFQFATSSLYFTNIALLNFQKWDKTKQDNKHDKWLEA